eukprot:PITA_11317
MTREAQKQRSTPTITKRTYNNVSALESEIECSICNNFGHEDSECRSRFWKTTQKEQTSSAKTWRMKEPQPERCGIALYAEGQENQWYIDSGCSKHMTAIKGKGIAQLKEKVKAGNVLYVDGLKHNLLSVSQMCDNGTKVIFRSDGCSVRDIYTGRTSIKGRRTPNNLYIFEEGEQKCYLSKNDEHWLWHQRLGHLSFSQIRKACKYQAVCGLLDIKIPDNTICKSCQFGKKTRTNFPEKEGSASRPLEIVHTDIKCLRSDRGGEFTSNEFFDFCEEHGIRREFSTARNPQQNGVAERMNRTIQQMARAMLDEFETPATFWGEAAYAVVVILNKTNVRVNNTQTPHELWYGETPSIKHFKIFGSKCYIKNTDEHLSKLEPRVDEGILLGYSPYNKAYKFYNKRLGRIVDNIDVVVDEKGYIPRQVNHEDIEEDEDYPQNQTNGEEETYEEETHEEPEEQIRVEEKTPSRYVQKNHPESQILGQKEAGVQTRRTIAEASS